MRRAIRVAMRLYPRAWRERYGREFEALLEDVGPGWRELWDVVTGALKMQMMTWTWTKTAAAFALAGAVVAGVVAVRTPNQYISTAVVKAPGVTDEREVARTLQLAQAEVLSRTSLATIVMQRNLYPEDRKRIPLEDVIQSMRNRDIQIRPLHGTDGAPWSFYISFVYPDRTTAREVTHDLTDRIVESAKSGRRAVTLEVLDEASLPWRPSEPNRLAIVGVGTAVGLTIGLLFLGIRRWPIVAACGFAAAAAALALAFLLPDRYVSTAVLQLDGGGEFAPLVQATLSDGALSHMIETEYDLYRYERNKKKTPLGQVVQRMRDRDIRVTPVPGHVPGGMSAIAISFAYPDRYKAQAVVRSLVTRIMEQNVVQARLASERSGRHNLEVLDPASFPMQAVSPNRFGILLLGLALGLGGGIWMARRRKLKGLAAVGA